MKKNILAVLPILIVSLSLTACGLAVPEITEEENAQIVEYAAGLLLKYDKNSESRLVEQTEEAEEPAEDQEALEQEEPKQEDMEQPEEEQNTQEVVNEIPQSTIEVFYGINNVEIKYAGYEMKNRYPEDDPAFSLNATEGCELLLLNFDVYNSSEQEVSLDMVSLRPKFKISLNNTKPKYALTTMLTNDLSTYIGKIPAGTSVRLVLVGEIQMGIGADIQTVSLMMKNDTQDAVAILN